MSNSITVGDFNSLQAQELLGPLLLDNPETLVPTRQQTITRIASGPLSISSHHSGSNGGGMTPATDIRSSFTSVQSSVPISIQSSPTSIQLIDWDHIKKHLMDQEFRPDNG